MINRNLTEDEKALIDDVYIRNEFREQYINELGIEPTEEELTDYMIDFFIDDDGFGNKTTQSNDSPFSKLLGGIFLLWFIASFIGMIYFFSVNPNIGLMIFGQYFLVFGIIALFNKVLMGLIFALVGLGIIVVPILIRHPELLSFAVNWEFLAIFTFGLIFMIAGICLNIMLIYENFKKKKKCITSVCASIISIRGDKRKIPVYEYEFNGKKYKVKGPSLIDCYKGQVVNLLINPNKPRDVYFKYSIRDNLFIHIFSIPFIASGIFLVVIAFLNFL